jgi:tetratricopeptide (TPR) repeat protein
VMGWLYTRAGNLKKAEEWMDYGVKIAPESTAAHSGMAAWLVEQGRGDEAQSHVDAIVNLGPLSGETRKLVGLAARQRKDLDAAEKAFQAMADESPADAWARNQLALVLAEQKDPAKQKRAAELAELSVRQHPKAGDSLATLGTVYFRLGRLDDADKLLAAVFQNGQCRSDDLLTLARVEAARGKKDAVVPLLKKALATPGLFLERNDARRWLEELEGAKK